MDQDKKDFKYYAFISYSRNNSAAAAYLHRKLEHFHIPRKLLANDRSSRFLRPIFRDRRDLATSAGNFTEDIKNALAESRFLIVLCSPDAACSPWVDKEVRYFLENHGCDYSLIVPVVLDGNPGSGKDDECLPEALRDGQIMLRNLPNMKPESGEKVKAGWENGVVQTLSYLLNVQRDRIRAAVDTEKVYLFRICAVIAIAVMIGFGGLTAWALLASHRAQLAMRESEAARQEAEIARQEAECSEREAQNSKNEAESNARAALRQTKIATWSMSFLHNMFTYSEAVEQYSSDVSGNEENMQNKIIRIIRENVGQIRELPWEMQVILYPDFAMMLASHGAWEEALELIRIACELNREHRPGSLEMLRCMEMYGRINWGNRNLDEALRVFLEALAMWKEFNADGKYNAQVIKLSNTIGYVYFDRKDFDSALDYHRQSFDLSQSGNSVDRHTVAAICVAVGNDLAGRGEHEKALDWHIRALEAYRELYPDDNHIIFAHVYACVANVYIYLGRYDDALVNACKSLDIRLHFLGEEHPVMASSYSQLSYIHLKKEDCDKALEYSERALELRRKYFGEKHENVARSCRYCGEICLRMDNSERATELFGKALDIFRAVYGESHPETLACRNLYDQAVTASGVNKPISEDAECSPETAPAESNPVSVSPAD